MTREEAINTLNASDYLWCRPNEKEQIALNMAIEALHREEAEAKGYCHRIIPKECLKNDAINRAEQKLREMPRCLNGVKEKQIKKISADAVQGEWVDVKNEPYCECSVCGSYIDNLDDDYAFCPRCGARMKGGAE